MNVGHFLFFCFFSGFFFGGGGGGATDANDVIAPGRRCFDVQVPLREMEAFSSVNAAELLGEVKGMVKADRVSGGGGGGGGGAAAAVHVVYIFSSCLTFVCVVSERFFSVFHGSCSSHGVWHPNAAWYLESTFSHSLESEKSYHINLSNTHRQPLRTRSRLHTTPMYVLGRDCMQRAPADKEHKT